MGSPPCRSDVFWRSTWPVNAEVESADDSQPISLFCETAYKLWVEANKKESTAHSYQQIWTQRLAGHFGAAALADYRTSDASKFLTGLADSGLGRNAIGHARSLMSGIFSHAVNLGQLDRNPLREAKCLSKMRPPKPLSLIPCAKSRT